VRKELRASLEGKEAACGKLAERAALREGRHITARVTLTDGAEPLQEQMLRYLPAYTLVLDIIHATEYLWESANAVLGKPIWHGPPGYGHYLAHGWTFGTGVVEGACRHLVKDRMEQAGMRWTKAGAQAVLDLRAVRLSGDWDAYWQFHRHKQHERLYGAATRLPDQVEAQALQRAA
jgi:hypothetical protein